MSQTVVPRVLVLGGTGHYGSTSSAAWRTRRTVRVLSRNAPTARLLLGAAPDIVEGDVTSETARRTALQGMDALVIAVSAMAPALIRETKAIEEDAILALLAEAKELAVNRIAAGAPQAHRLLTDTFSFQPTTLEMEAQRWRAAQEKVSMTSPTLSEKASAYLQRLCLEIESRRVGSAGNRAATDFFAGIAGSFGFEIATPPFRLHRLDR